MLNKTAERDLGKSHWYTLKLRQWRDMEVQRKFSDSHMQYFPSLIMPDEVLDSLATWAEHISDEATMRRWVGGLWSEIEHYWSDVLEIIERGQAMRLDEKDMFEVWKEHNDLKRKRISTPVINPSLVEFEERRDAWIIKRGYDSKKNTKTRKATKRGSAKAKQGKGDSSATPKPVIVGNDLSVSNLASVDPVLNTVIPESSDQAKRSASKSTKVRRPLAEIAPNVSNTSSSRSTSKRANRKPSGKFTS